VAVAWVGVGMGIIAITTLLIGFSAWLLLKRRNDLKDRARQSAAARDCRLKEAERVKWHKMKRQAMEVSLKSKCGLEINQFDYGSEPPEGESRDASANPPHPSPSKIDTFISYSPKTASNLEVNSTESDESIESLLRHAEEAMLNVEEQRKRSRMDLDNA